MPCRSSTGPDDAGVAVREGCHRAQGPGRPPGTVDRNLPQQGSSSRHSRHTPLGRESRDKALVSNEKSDAAHTEWGGADSKQDKDAGRHASGPDFGT